MKKNSMTKPKKATQFGIRVTDAMRVAYEAIAKRRGEHVSKTLRRVLEDAPALMDEDGNFLSSAPRGSSALTALERVQIYDNAVRDVNQRVRAVLDDDLSAVLSKALQAALADALKSSLDKTLRAAFSDAEGVPEVPAAKTKSGARERARVVAEEPRANQARKAG